MAKIKTKARIKTNKEEKFVDVPIKFHVPDTIITRYVTNSTVQIMEEELKISFFEMKPELRFDIDTAPPSEVQADCVGSVIMTADRISRLINVLKQQLDKYNARQDEIKKLLPKPS
jgi:hypothetical protein|tara:strand:- start:77 stop:424 length:348 start_codon:yes stop_codon:yes gene_type:complete